jgi:hypothetical protein
MPYIQTSHYWESDDDDSPCVVESHGPTEDTKYPITETRIIINFGHRDDDKSEASVGGLSLDDAEKLARQILDVVVDARMGRFTGFVRKVT